MKIIRDGNFAPWLRLLLVGGGVITISFSSLFLEDAAMYIGSITGLVIAAIGAYAEKANAFGLRPFDGSYTKAKQSYDKKGLDKD